MPAGSRKITLSTASKKSSAPAPLFPSNPGETSSSSATANHIPVAKLSLKARDSWAGRVDKIRSISLIAMVQRTKDDEQQDFRKSCRTDSREIPWAEVVLGP
ncbi:MAG: hypothetical protein P4L55_16230 [Syntrophobacteraceae bacterium]|nr:hypothetical protein [Syntrophobacteraceae bacterium]